MVDSCDRDRIAESKSELFNLFLHPDFASPYLLIFGNKQDVPSALSATELVEQLDLHSLPPKVIWRLQTCSVVYNEGTYEGFEWLENLLGNHEDGLLH